MVDQAADSSSNTWADQLSRRLWARLATLPTEAKPLLLDALQYLLELSRSEGTALVVASSGRWNLEAARGQGPMPDEGLISEAVDADRARVCDGWAIAPVRWQGASAAVVCYQPAEMTADAMQGVASVLQSVFAALHGHLAVRARAQRAEAILNIVAEWQQTRATDKLLQRMAETSTRLLGCERASIFLWDRPHRMLVARPALGVEGGELRVPDDKGVVGRVLQSGRPCRVNVDEDQRQIDRSVDRRLNFHTESLLAVPLLGANGERFGVFELINKQDGRFTEDDESALVMLARHAATALETTRDYEQLLRARDQIVAQAAAGVHLLGRHPAMEALQSTIRRVADTDLAILILGENGTGKEVVSQMIHYLSRRRREPFVAVNCAALTETLLESELFGHEKGAFTDAHESRPGKFELAAQGTLFLDEIADMSLSGQAKLLRVLEEKVVVRVGGSRPIHTDARIIAATNRDLATLVREKRFREDLYFRLNVVALRLPPLRDRGDDIVLLAEHFLQDFSRKANRPVPRFTAAARRRLLEHRWPGNVRELRNLMERMAYLHPQPTIDAADLSFVPSAPAPTDELSRLLGSGSTLTQATRAFQIAYIERQIAQAKGNVSEAARRLGLHRANLYRKMQQLNMRPHPEAPDSGDAEIS